MFRSAPGHVAEDNPLNRANIRMAGARTIVQELNGGTVRRAWIAPGGNEWWATVNRSGVIINGGMNRVPFYLTGP